MFVEAFPFWTAQGQGCICPAMRNMRDRIRHTILFETLGLCISTPLAAWLLGRHMASIGIMAVYISGMAMAGNYVFNLAFDHALVFLDRPVHVRPPWMRAVHAALFEVFLLLFTVPFVAWWLDMTIIHAFLTDIGFAAFYLVFAYLFNWAYDVVFPMPVEEAFLMCGQRGKWRSGSSIRKSCLFCR